MAVREIANLFQIARPVERMRAGSGMAVGAQAAVTTRSATTPYYGLDLSEAYEFRRMVSQS
jgi:hypothetical protein